MCAVAAAKSLQSCPTLCDPKDGSPPGSPVPGILQARTLEWVAILLQCMKVRSESEVTQSCLTLRDRMDCSPPGSSIHGIFQARVLEWGAIVSRQTTCWNPIPNMRVLRCRGLGRWLGPESGAPWMGWVPLEEGPEGLHLLSVVWEHKRTRTTHWPCLAPWSTSQPPELWEINAEATVCGILLSQP